MKGKLYLFLSAILLAAQAAFAQNAQQLYFNQLSADYDYQAASFVVDTPPASSPLRRAFLLWSKNFTKDPALQGITLDEFDPAGNFLSERINSQPGLPTEYLLPKKIIKAQRVRGYYLLGYVIKSPHLVNGFPVYSTPLVIRLDDNLNLVWIYKIHFSTIFTGNAQSVIEYNDILESVTGDLVLAGRFSDAPGQRSRVLLSRLNNTGTLLWSHQYYINSCNAEALSIAEASNRNIALTGYAEECSSTFSGPRRLLFATVNPSGIPVLIRKLISSNHPLSGAKIVRHTNIPNSDEFFITGYMDLTAPTGAVNKQIILADVKESGGVISFHHIGDARDEAANDLLFTDLGGGAYSLYLTGYTGSYYSNVRTEVFYLQLRYNGALTLAEFSTFPSTNSSYVARRGLEIRSAGKERFAILANSDFSFPPQRTYSHVMIRDLTDPTGECIKRHDPPVRPFPLLDTMVSYNMERLPFTIYRDDFKPFDKVYPRPECGHFFIDPYSTLPLAAPALAKLLPVQAPEPTLAALRVYPNPVHEQLYIDYGKVLNAGIITARIFTLDMKLVKEVRLEGGNRNNISLSGLHNGMYFVQIQHNGAVKMVTIKKE